MQEESKQPNGDSEAIRVYKTSDVASFFNPTQMHTLATFDPKTPEGRRMMILAAMDECPSIKDYINKTIAISHIYAHPASRVDERTGVVQTWYRIVMLDGNGTAIECGSAGIGKSLALLAMMYDNPPWHPPLKCDVKVVALNGGRNFYKLVPSDREPESPPTRVRQSKGPNQPAGQAEVK